ncbi:hypothetical protein LUZ60_010700 [Juncus effusus]|nr:hypothetical protein LUZ60_010700 [Juncus effusus]
MAGVETVDQRPRMPRELLKAAIEGDVQVLTEMLRLEEDGGHTSASIEPAAYVEIDKNLKSATFMGNTVLHVLCANNHGELASKVCKKDGSLFRARNKMLETPLHYAAKGIVNKEAISALIEFARSKGKLILKEVLRVRNNHGETALHVIARYADYLPKSILDKMLEGDPEWAYQVDNDGMSSLDVAMARGVCSVMSEFYSVVSEHMISHLNNQRILSRICCSRANQPSALHTTIQSAEIVQKRMKLPASVVINRSSPIHIAAAVNNTDRVQQMLNLDPSLAYLQDSDGMFPVHVAAGKGNVEMVLLFMQHCLDSGDLVDHRERNFLHIAAEENKPNVFVRLFETSHTTTNNIIPSWNTILRRMIDAGDNEGNTPLHIAAGKGYISLTREMIYILHFLRCEYDHVRNRKGLSAFDVSLIQVKAQAGNSREMRELIGQYLEDYGEHLNLVWYETVMASVDTNSNGSSMTDQLQIIGLGAVLITTVTFAAAFTFPGGYNTNGSPVLAGKYLFKAFMLAVTSAFLQSFFCVLMLMIGGLYPVNRRARGTFLAIAMYLFSGGARSMVLSFGLGLYLVLAPANKGISILILLLTIFSVMLDITPNVLRFITINLNYLGAFKKEIKKYYCSECPWILTFLVQQLKTKIKLRVSLLLIDIPDGRENLPPDSIHDRSSAKNLHLRDLLDISPALTEAACGIVDVFCINVGLAGLFRHFLPGSYLTQRKN